MKHHAPTQRTRVQGAPNAPIGASRVQPKPPQIFVQTNEEPNIRRMREAHLRNNRGYVYLCWRQEGTVKNFYLGKAPRSYPTKDPTAPARSSSRPDPGRKARNSPKNRASLLQVPNLDRRPTRSTPKNALLRPPLIITGALVEKPNRKPTH